MPTLAQLIYVSLSISTVAMAVLLVTMLVNFARAVQAFFAIRWLKKAAAKLLRDMVENAAKPEAKPARGKNGKFAKKFPPVEIHTN